MQKVALVQASVWSVPSRNPSFWGSVPTLAGFVQALPSQVAMTSSPIAAQNRAAAQKHTRAMLVPETDSEDPRPQSALASRNR